MTFIYICLNLQIWILYKERYLTNHVGIIIAITLKQCFIQFFYISDMFGYIVSIAIAIAIVLYVAGVNYALRKEKITMFLC